MQIIPYKGDAFFVSILSVDRGWARLVCGLDTSISTLKNLIEELPKPQKKKLPPFDLLKAFTKLGSALLLTSTRTRTFSS